MSAGDFWGRGEAAGRAWRTGFACLPAAASARFDEVRAQDAPLYAFRSVERIRQPLKRVDTSKTRRARICRREFTLQGHPQKCPQEIFGEEEKPQGGLGGQASLVCLPASARFDEVRAQECALIRVSLIKSETPTYGVLYLFSLRLPRRHPRRHGDGRRDGHHPPPAHHRRRRAENRPVRQSLRLPAHESARPPRPREKTGSCARRAFCGSFFPRSPFPRWAPFSPTPCPATSCAAPSAPFSSSCPSFSCAASLLREKPRKILDNFFRVCYNGGQEKKA